MQDLPFNPDIILINCPQWRVDFPPLGILYVHEALKLAGFSSVFWDINLDLYLESEYREYWDSQDTGRWYHPDFIDTYQGSIAAMASQIAAAQPKVVGFSVNEFSKEFSLRLAKEIKQLSQNIPIVLGGFDCIDPEILPHYSPIPDYYVVGDAEYTAPILLSRLLSGTEDTGRSLPGVMVNDANRHGSFQHSALSDNLDAIPYPKYGDVSLGRYAQGRVKRALVIATRGCAWGKCAFCDFPGTLRERSPEHVFEEMKYLYGLGVRRLDFADQDFNNNPDSLMRLCDLLIADGLGRKITLGGTLRISKHSDEMFFRKLKRAGFWAVAFGVETGSNRVLRLMRKGITRELAEQNLRAAKKAGLGIGVNVIVGFPGETYDDFLDTLKWLIEMVPYYDLMESVNMAVVHRRSYLHSHQDKYGIFCGPVSQGACDRFCVDWTMPNDPRNTRLNRELRREIVMRIANSVGIEFGRYVQVNMQTDGRRMGEHEKELWDLVERTLGINLSSKSVICTSPSLLLRWWNYRRRCGIAVTMRVSADYIERRIRRSI